MTDSEKLQRDSQELEDLKSQFSALKAGTLELCDKLEALRAEEARLQAGNALLAEELASLGIAACQAQMLEQIAGHTEKTPATALSAPSNSPADQEEENTSGVQEKGTNKRSAPKSAAAPAAKRPASGNAQNLVRTNKQLMMMKGSVPQMMASVNQAMASNPMLQLLATPGLNLGATLNMAMNPVLNPNLHRGFLPRPPPNKGQKR